MDTANNHVAGRRPWMTLLLVSALAACGPMPGDDDLDLGEEADLERVDQPITNATSVSASENDLLVGIESSGSLCSGSLLTNKWAITARHCPATPGNVIYGRGCTSNSDCTRGGTCLTTGIGPYCGVPSAFHTEPPLPEVPSAKDVRMVRLSAPLRLTGSSGNYTIARRLYYGSEASLLDKDITVFGAGGVPPTWTFTKGLFKVTETDHVYSYVFSPVNPANATIVGGDSGGPGIWSGGGFTYLTGVTATEHPSQHDIPEIYPWVVNTLYDIPRIVQFDTRAHSMALTSAGAHAFSRLASAPGTIVHRSCSREPCDARGEWSQPFTVTTSATSDPAAVSDGSRARVYVKRSSGGNNVMTRAQNADGTWGSWQTVSGACASAPAANARPGTSPSTLDVVCVGTDAKLYHASRKGSNAHTAFASLGAPPPGLRAGSNAGVVSTSASTTYVVAVGRDGAAWIRKGVAGRPWGAWTSIQGGDIRWVAITSFEANRLDVLAVTGDGRLHVRIFDGAHWSPLWVFLEKGAWDAAYPPFAAALVGHKGRMNVGAIQGGAAHVQRYSDF
jgi:hypothetical protein